MNGSLHTEMLQYWFNNCTTYCSDPTDQPDPPQDFWMHEWNKHGTCMKSYPEFANITQDMYFDYVLDLYQSLMDNGTINDICGVPTCGANCYKLCLDLDFNVIDCPSMDDGTDASWFWIVFITVAIFCSLM